MVIDALGRAKRAKISDVTVIGSHLVGLSADGGLFKLCGDRWIRLELTSHLQRHARRLVRYSGHHDSARSANV